MANSLQRLLARGPSEYATRLLLTLCLLLLPIGKFLEYLVLGWHTGPTRSLPGTRSAQTPVTSASCSLRVVARGRRRLAQIVTTLAPTGARLAQIGQTAQTGTPGPG